MEIFTLILPVFLVFLLGLLFKHLKLVKPEMAGLLVQFVLYVSAPALLIRVIADIPFREIWNWPFILAYGAPLFFVFFVLFSIYRFLCKKSLNDSTMYALSSTMSNAGFVGLPILYAIFGQQAMLPATLSIIIVLALLSLGLVILEAGLHKGVPFWISTGRAFRGFIKNPLIIATCAGILYSLFSLPKPNWLFNFLKILEGSLTPCALFAVGMQIDFKSFFLELKETFFIYSIKLVVFPVLILVIVLTFKLPPIWAISAVVVGALPTAKSCIMICGLYDLEESKKLSHKVSMVIAFTTLSSILTLFLWLLFLSYLFPNTFVT